MNVSTQTDLSVRWRDRVVPAVLLLAVAAVLGVAASLDPNPSGMGTHHQLGLPPCGIVTYMRLPCATCGMTTAFSHAARGQLLSAIITQPAGAVLAVISAMVGLVSAYALVTGLPLGPMAAGLWKPRWLWMLGGLVLVSWVYKIFMVWFYV